MTRSVLITGASTGIGAACALHLDAQGWQVFAGIRQEADGERLRAQGSDRLLPVMIDVTEEDSIERCRAQIVASTGTGLSALINNAGIVLAAPLEIVPITELRKQIEVNVIGQVAVTQAMLPQLREARGRIVNMGSISGLIANPLMGPYAASKFALEAINDSLRRELGGWGIHVSIVEPGPIQTPIWKKSEKAGSRLWRSFREDQRELYSKPLAHFRARVKEADERADPVDAVVRVVVHALNARRPRTRYVVGRDARLAAALRRFIPDRWLDRIIAWKFSPKSS